jgi:putative glutamine amidotransferase
MENYTNAIEECGGEPRLFAALEKSIPKHLASIPEYLAEIDGLLLPGGGDIDPCHFFQARHHAVKGVSRSRDALEIRLFQEALEADLPIFGICRGIQVMSVAMGGNLYQDVPSQFPQALRHKKVDEEDSRHEIEIEPGSLLSELTGARVAEVNSAHHQAVNEVGKGFVVTARAKDEIIETIENPSREFVLGVQYHPERMLKDPKLCQHAQKLFEAFINAAECYCCRS